MEEAFQLYQDYLYAQACTEAGHKDIGIRSAYWLSQTLYTTTLSNAVRIKITNRFLGFMAQNTLC